MPGTRTPYKPTRLACQANLSRFLIKPRGLVTCPGRSLTRRTWSVVYADASAGRKETRRPISSGLQSRPPGVFGLIMFSTAAMSQSLAPWRSPLRHEKAMTVCHCPRGVGPTPSHKDLHRIRYTPTPDGFTPGTRNSFPAVWSLGGLCRARSPVRTLRPVGTEWAAGEGWVNILR